MALVFLGERVTPRQWLATALCIVGALVIVRGAALIVAGGLLLIRAH